jgi:Icc-related predicted phosphoesterase
MEISSDAPERDGGARRSIRIATAGDIHCGRQAACEHLRSAVEDVAQRVDCFLLAGDLTTHGEPEQGQILAQAFAEVDVPILTVLGNHDWHVDRRDELVAVLEEAGMTVLEHGAHRVLDINGAELGVVGAKGFVGGFPGSHLPDFGEPLLREVYAESIREAQGIEAGLRAVAACPLRIVLLHYAPCTDTLVGEPEPIWTFLGTDRLAGPIIEHEPDLVLHGHAHAGTFEGRVGQIPVFNVSVPVLGKDFWELELTVAERAASAIH